jgi:multidrug resistance efflux pump
MIGSVLRRYVLPWAVWGGVMGTAGWLWLGLNGGSARGYVDSVAYGVATPLPGRVATLSVEVGQRVRAGEVVATLDASEITAELATLAAERVRVEAEIAAVATSTRADVGESSREIEESVEAAEIAEQSARAARSVAAAQLAALDEQVKLVRDLIDKHMADRRELAELAVSQAALSKELQESEGLVRRLGSQVASTRTRRGAVPSDAVDRATDPLVAELIVLRREEQLLMLRKEALSLRAPGDGEVTEVFLRPGQVAMAGAPVASIIGPAGATTGGTPLVAVCLDELRAANVRIGEAVELAAPDGRGATLPGRVERLAAEVGELPQRCWRDPRLAEWGRPAWVALDEALPLLSGQSFMVSFLGRMSTSGPRTSEQAATPASDPEVTNTPPPVPRVAPAPIRVPPALAARSRFEPSGIVWSPALQRYVVVSDDTGLADGADEHAPWLFTMDASGVVDPEPVVIEGIDEIRDVESIAAAPDGGLYVLSAQSFSKGGKRSPARQRFVHVALADGRARATAKVHLATLLDAAGSAALTKLGITSTAELEIEGLTATSEGGLLLGLKAPLASDGEAIVWHLRQPDALLGTGELVAGELTQWGHVRLPVTAGGASADGGISELLELDGGELLVAATPSAKDAAADQGGALVRVSGRQGLASPRLVRTFPGLKPEGLARTPNSDAIMIVFDAAAATPSWMELRWPAD